MFTPIYVNLKNFTVVISRKVHFTLIPKSTYVMVVLFTIEVYAIIYPVSNDKRINPQSVIIPF